MNSDVDICKKKICQSFSVNVDKTLNLLDQKVYKFNTRPYLLLAVEKYWTFIVKI